MTLQLYQRYVPGQQLSDFSSHRLQNAADEVRQAGNINTGPGLQLSKTPSGTSIRLDPQQRRFVPSGLKAKLLFVKQVNDNTLDCVDESGAALTIAKPLDLQLQRYFGPEFPGGSRKRGFTNAIGQPVAVTYTVSDFRATKRIANVVIAGITTGVTELITPPYAQGEGDMLNDPVLAVRVGEALTGVSGVPWIDWNNAGRAWAEAEETA